MYLTSYQVNEIYNTLINIDIKANFCNTIK